MSLAHLASGDRSRLLADALLPLGYSNNHIRTEWKYSNYALMKKWIEDDDPDNFPTNEAPAILDTAAFYDSREQNWNTISLAAQLNRLDLVRDKKRGADAARRIFEETASPCVLFAGNGTADLWLRCWEEPSPVKDISFEPQQLRKAFDQHRRDLERDALAALRGGHRYLFDGFHLARRDELATFLNRGITKATWFGHKVRRPLDEDSGKALSRVAIGLLAARVLEDKGNLGAGGDQSTDARQLLQEANRRMNGFFRHVIETDLARLDGTISARFVDEMLLRIMAHLTGPACFSMVTAEMLGDLYENVLRAQRKSGKDLELNGVHYTPLALTRNVLHRIPVEELNPSRRRALDIACGSGTFLLAATERLREAFDANEADAEITVLEHLRQRVIGNDQDGIALHVASLTYLLEHVIQTGDPQSVPSPRLWEGDALGLTSARFGAYLPSIVVGNPPFGMATDGEQLANKFLRKAMELLRPGGFLGMIMPGAFLKMKARGGTANVRRQLLETCDLLEVWELPLGAVGLSARQETCAVIARKRDLNGPRSSSVLFKLTYSRGRDAVRGLQQFARSTWTFMSTGLPGRPTVPWTSDETSRIIASPLDRIWEKVNSAETIGSFCDQTEGIKTSLSTTSFSSQELARYVPYLRTQERLSPYFLVEADWRNDPDADHDYVDPSTAPRSREGRQPLLRGPKLVVTSNTNRNSRSQLKVAFDDAGVFPEHNFKCLALREDRSRMTEWARTLVAREGDRSVLLWLAAVLNNPLAHAWVATYSPPRSTSIHVFMSLPVPSTYDPVIPELVSQTREHGRLTGDFLRLTSEINSAVLRSYGLDASESSEVQRFLDGLIDPWAESSDRAHIPQRRAYRRISGTVVSVDVQSQTVSLDLPRYSRDVGGPITLALPPEMPGWALREGVDFTCSVPTDCRDADELRKNPWLLRYFRLVPYSYLDDDQLEELVSSEHSGLSR